jgi:hypothetical protein
MNRSRSARALKGRLVSLDAASLKRCPDTNLKNSRLKNEDRKLNT